MTVSVNGLPSGVNGAVTVAGPGGYTATVTATTTLSGLTAGSYTVTAAPTRSTAPVVDFAYTVAGGGGAVSVSAGTTSTTSVTYALLPGSGKLWIVDTQAGIDGFTNSQLTGSGGAITPAVQVKTGGTPQGGLALDAAGDLWLGVSGHLYEYTPSQLVSTATPPPAVTINNDNNTDLSLIRPLDLAFDPQGDLWVSNCNGNIEMFTPSQLAVDNSSPTPNAEITSVSCAVGMTFDTQGDLWFSEPQAAPPAIAEFTAAQLTTAAGNVSSPSPHVVLTSTSFTSSTSNTPAGIAFDGGGNLWVANSSAAGSSDAALWMFPTSQIVSSGTATITPSVVLKDDGSGDLTPAYYLAFDNSGDLWVSSQELAEFAPTDLQSSGSPSPTVAITIVASPGTQGAFPEIALDPPPATP
ncbi:MAG: hypothetical protein P8Z81_02985 [Deinococcales bacterium]